MSANPISGLASGPDCLSSFENHQSILSSGLSDFKVRLRYAEEQSKMTLRHYPFSINNDPFEFSVVSGTVLSTDQRSDTRVWGGGATIVVDGTGGGGTTIDSRVDVVCDLWLRADNGQDHHFRFNQDIPLREGHRVYCIFLSGKDLNTQQKFETAYSVFDASVNKCWHLGGVANAVKMPKYVSGGDWFLGVVLTFFFGIGLLLLAWLISLKFSGRPSTEGAKRIQSALLSGIKDHHQKLIDELYTAYQLQKTEAVAAVR